MTYTEMLNELIDNSGKMQKDIARECSEKYGVKLTNTYLSTLKTTEGKKATDDISRAIAKACNAPYEDILVVQAYLDKAPQIIVDFIKAVQGNNELGAECFEAMGAKNNPWAALIMAGMKAKAEQSLAEFVCEMVADSEATEDVAENLPNQLEQAQKEQEGKWLVIPPEGAKALMNAQYIKEQDIKKVIKIDPAE